MATLGERSKSYRRVHSLSLRQLEGPTGVNYTTILRAERGKEIVASSAQKLSDFLDGKIGEPEVNIQDAIVQLFLYGVSVKFLSKTFKRSEDDIQEYIRDWNRNRDG